MGSREQAKQGERLGKCTSTLGVGDEDLVASLAAPILEAPALAAQRAAKGDFQRGRACGDKPFRPLASPEWSGNLTRTLLEQGNGELRTLGEQRNLGAMEKGLTVCIRTGIHLGLPTQIQLLFVFMSFSAAQQGDKTRLSCSPKQRHVSGWKLQPLFQRYPQLGLPASN